MFTKLIYSILRSGAQGAAGVVVAGATTPVEILAKVVALPSSDQLLSVILKLQTT